MIPEAQASHARESRWRKRYPRKPNGVLTLEAAAILGRGDRWRKRCLRKPSDAVILEAAAILGRRDLLKRVQERGTMIPQARVCLLEKYPLQRKVKEGSARKVPACPAASLYPVEVQPHARRVMTKNLVRHQVLVEVLRPEILRPTLNQSCPKCLEEGVE